MPLSVGCTACPGRARDNKTGSWRVFRPTFKHSKCTKCGICSLICPEGCIEVGADEYYYPNLVYCKGCGLCAQECPAEDIEMEQEAK
ncbi:MAG: 4Fe-4S binding protein [Methanomicrobiales archaeon]|nr:4Fe-4S binding protein [Methanomicrobiales archaeon]